MKKTTATAPCATPPTYTKYVLSIGSDWSTIAEYLTCTVISGRWLCKDSSQGQQFITRVLSMKVDMTMSKDRESNKSYWWMGRVSMLN